MKLSSRWAFAALILMVTPGALSELAPAIKWAQDRKHLMVTVNMDCSKGKTFSPTELNFHLECTGAAGKKEMSFALREHIDPAKSSCKTAKAGEELCMLEKKYPHFFDRLVENTEELKHLKQDWFRWNEEDENNVPDDPYEGVNTSWVKPFKMENITQALQEGKVVFADIGYPWCSTCSFTVKPFVAAARKFSSDNVVFARVDAREDKQAAANYNATCDQSDCDFQVLRADEDPEKIEGKADKDEMLKAFKAYMKPPMTKVATDDEADQFIAKHAKTALVLCKGGVASAECKLASAAAKKVRGKVNVMYAEQNLKGFSGPAVKLFVKGQEGAIDIPMDSDASTLAQALVVMSMPTLDSYTYDKRKLQKEYSLPVGMVWVPEKDDTMNSLFLSLAEELRGKVMMLKMGSSENFMLKDFGAEEKSGKEGGVFGIANGFEPTSDRYLFEGDMKSKEELKEFALKAIADEAPKAHKSEPVPSAEWKRGTVRQVVYKNAKTVASAGGVFVMLYKSWSSGIKKTEAWLEKIADAMHDVEEVTIAKLEMSKNYVDPALFPGVDEFAADPVAFKCPGGDEPCVKYTDPLTQKDVLKNLAKMFPVVKKSWEDKVKPRLAAAKQAAKEKKEKEEKEKQEALAKQEAEKKEMEEKLATVEKQDVSSKKDEGIIKQVLTEGSGDSPKNGDKVKVHYTGTLLDGSKFDSSRDRDSPFTFGLGTRQVITCWDEGVATMKKGERAILTCKPDVAYGERGSPPKIPPSSTLRFDVELLSFGDDAKDEL